MSTYNISGFTQNDLKMFYNRYKKYLEVYNVLIDSYTKDVQNQNDIYIKNFNTLYIFTYLVKYVAYKSRNDNLFHIADIILEIINKKDIQKDDLDLLYNKIILIKNELSNYIEFLCSQKLDTVSKINILIVDDDDLALSVLIDKIKQINIAFEADIALNSNDAIDNLMYQIEKTGDIHDLIFIDIVMPRSDYNGITLLKFIRSIEDYTLNKIAKINKDYYYKYKPIIIHSNFIKSYEDLIKHIHTNDIELISKEECTIDVLKNIFKKYNLYDLK